MLRAVVVLAVLAGCPSRKHDMRVVLDQFEAFTNDMCACKDKACADHVQGKMTTWSTEMAKKHSDDRDQKPSEAQMKRMTALGTRYGECLTALMTQADPTPVAQPPAPADLPKEGSLDADALLRSARAWAEASRPGRFLSGAVIEYVDAEGQLDPKHGTLALTFGRVTPSHGSRRLGAPVEPAQTSADCMRVTYAGMRWDSVELPCGAAIDRAPRCSVRQVWQRAIAKQTPAEALAKIELTMAATGGTWRLSIDDEPRDVHIAHELRDDCALQVEKRDADPAADPDSVP